MERAVPTPTQRRWQDMEMGMFLHFGINTFTGREWGDGTEAEKLFNPRCLDAGQWVQTARDAGFRYVVFTAKHHDGFCNWPTATTAHSVKSSPWRQGRGDVVAEVAEACRKYGLGLGLYLSPWDRNAPCYPDAAAYDDFYCAQLTELLTGYGPLTEVWFDGAGSEGRMYDWERIIGLVDRYQPEAMIFNMGRPTIRWVGNEDGLAPDPCWNSAENVRDPMFLEAASEWLPDTPRWLPAECDVPIRRQNWFWGPDEESEVRSLPELMDIYYRSVGHGAGLLLNVSPDNRGLLPEPDRTRVLEFGDEVRRRFGRPLAASDSGMIALNHPETVNHAVLMEDIAGGERIRSYRLEARTGGQWRTIVRGTAVGHKKIDAFDDVTADAFRLTVEACDGEPVLRSFSVFRVTP